MGAPLYRASLSRALPSDEALRDVLVRAQNNLQRAVGMVLDIRQAEQGFERAASRHSGQSSSARAQSKASSAPPAAPAAVVRSEPAVKPASLDGSAPAPAQKEKAPADSTGTATRKVDTPAVASPMPPTETQKAVRKPASPAAERAARTATLTADPAQRMSTSVSSERLEDVGLPDADTAVAELMRVSPAGRKRTASDQGRPLTAQGSGAEACPAPGWVSPAKRQRSPAALPESRSAAVATPPPLVLDAAAVARWQRMAARPPVCAASSARVHSLFRRRCCEPLSLGEISSELGVRASPEVRRAKC